MNRALVYALLIVMIAGIAMLVVGSLGAYFQVSANLLYLLLATGLVVIVFQPLRTSLQRIVNRLMYGDRDDPYTTLSRLGQQLECSLHPAAILSAVAETAVRVLKLPYVAVVLEQCSEGEPTTLVEYGAAVGDLVALPLLHEGEQIGRLIVAQRAPGESFSQRDRRLLEIIAQQSGVAVHAVRLAEHASRLSAELQRSRERLISAREEERRRLRKDLHDGLGPTLGGLTLGIDAARSTLTRNPADADVLLSELKGQTRAAIADVRRLVYGLRPPALDDLGLVGAIRQHAAKLGDLSEPGWTNRGPGLVFVVEAPTVLTALPAAVEVAAYRISQEAMTNSACHAGAHSCRVHLFVDEVRAMLVLDITDDGVGIPQDSHIGTGMNSMRERASELGGTLKIEPVQGGGTRVRACLPLPAEEE